MAPTVCRFIYWLNILDADAHPYLDTFDKLLFINRFINSGNT